MIRQEEVGVNLPARLGAHHGEGFDETLALRLIQDDRLAPAATIQDVVNRAGILEP